MFRLKAPAKKSMNSGFRRPLPIQNRDTKPTSPNSRHTRIPPEMDPGIWSGLPDEILDLILSFLPFKILFILTSTCKRFRSLILSPHFASKHFVYSDPFSSFLLLSHPQFGHDRFPLYDTALHSWRRLALTCASSGEPSCLHSSSGGLLCFSFSGSSSSYLLVCNLLTRSSRTIESPFYPLAFELLTLIASPPNGYRIFTLSSSSGGFSHTHHRVYVYDSANHSWRKYDGFDQNLSRGFHQEGVVCNGSLYFAKTEPFLIVSFDLETGKWNRAAGNGSIPADELTFARLLSDSEKNRLYLVGGIGRNGISRSIKLWEFREEIWVETESLPEMICRKFMSVCYHNYEHIYCFWHKGMVCVCCYNWPELLYYNVSRRTWHWVPKCPSLPEKWSWGFRWFSFVPRLSASV